ncbi:hypothetical protein CPB86DRAFT_802923 [Serendipita vermifera]|nr:hypothetical protein CPB86DRAFT_802923 [Serendipita vermifera]
MRLNKLDALLLVVQVKHLVKEEFDHTAVNGQLGDFYRWRSRENGDSSSAMRNEGHPRQSTHPLRSIWREMSPLSVETNTEHFESNLNQRCQMMFDRKPETDAKSRNGQGNTYQNVESHPPSIPISHGHMRTVGPWVASSFGRLLAAGAISGTPPDGTDI